MNWIDVEITRPEIAEWVLCVCSKKSYWLAFRANGGWYISTNYGQLYVENIDRNKKIEIKYWMPLPQLPK